MGELFTPIGLVFMAWMYYLARKDGTIVYRQGGGYNFVIDDWLAVLYKDSATENPDMSSEERNRLKKDMIDKFEAALSSYLIRSSFPRLKIYDLRRAMSERISMPLERSKRLLVESVVSEAFKIVINRYDRYGQGWGTA